MKKDVVMTVRNLRVNFSVDGGKVQAVRGINFDLHKGETLAIVGESGSGKSATARAILGILAVNADVRGEILYENTNLVELSEREFSKRRGRKISMVFQNPTAALDPVVNVGKQLTEAVLMRNRGKPLKEKMSRKIAKQTALQLLKEVGMQEVEKKYKQYPFELSGGQRQRVVIAIALAANPEIMICDEPTTALDATVQAQILELLNSIKKEKGVSVIFITHDLGVVSNIADRVAVMYAGKIVETGTVDEVFFTPLHPYTAALLNSAPDINTNDRLKAISGTPPDMLNPPVGDAFAARNPRALKIDFLYQPPTYRVSPTHSAATWLLHPLAKAKNGKNDNE